MTSYETHLALAQERHDAAILAQNDDAETTPAIERAAEAVGEPTPSGKRYVRRALAAALDVEEMARALAEVEWEYTLYGAPRQYAQKIRHTPSHYIPDCPLCRPDLNDGYTKIAAALRASILGTSS